MVAYAIFAPFLVLPVNVVGLGGSKPPRYAVVIKTSLLAVKPLYYAKILRSLDCYEDYGSLHICAYYVSIFTARDSL